MDFWYLIIAISEFWVIKNCSKLSLVGTKLQYSQENRKQSENTDYLSFSSDAQQSNNLGDLSGYFDVLRILDLSLTCDQWQKEFYNWGKISCSWWYCIAARNRKGKLAFLELIYHNFSIKLCLSPMRRNLKDQRKSWTYWESNTYTKAGFFLFQPFSPLARAGQSMDTSSPSPISIVIPFFNPNTHIILHHILPSPSWSSPPSRPCPFYLWNSTHVCILPLLNTCPNHLKQGVLNHSSIDSTCTISVTSELQILSLKGQRKYS